MRLVTIVCVLLAASFAWAQDIDSHSTSPSLADPHDKAGEQLVAIVSIQVVQGTDGGPKVGGLKATVELLDAHSHGTKFEVQLGPNGTASIEIPLSEPFKPMVKVQYGAATYHTIGQEINASSLEQMVSVTVYETTDQPVDWHVQERHVVLRPTLEGIGVTDTLVIQNPSDKAWLGAGDDAGQRVSLVIDLPAGATKVEFGGNLQMLGAMVTGEKVICTGPLQPGQDMFRFSYLIPLSQHANHVVITSPARSVSLLVFVPADDNSQVYAQSNGEHLESLGLYDMKGTSMLVFGATDQLAGQKLTMVFSGLPRQLTQAEQTIGSPYVARIVAAVGSIVMLVLGMIALLPKPGRTVLPSQE